MKEQEIINAELIKEIGDIKRTLDLISGMPTEEKVLGMIDKKIYTLPTKKSMEEFFVKVKDLLSNPATIARALETLQGFERLSARAIKGLPIPVSYAYTNAVSSGGGTTVSVVDLSSQTDGVTSSFLMPAYSTILMVIITGWAPNGILRPTVDFTLPDSTHIALVTSQVAVPASGTTLIVLYVPA